MNHITPIYGFYERVDQACIESGFSKMKIARRCGFDRKILCPRDGMMHATYIAKFCAVVGVSADWLLGLKRDRK